MRGEVLAAVSVSPAVESPASCPAFRCNSRPDQPLEARAGIWQIGARDCRSRQNALRGWYGMALDENSGRRGGTRFHPRHRQVRPQFRPGEGRRYAVPAGTERLPPYRARQVDLPELRHRRGIRWPLPSALRRYKPHKRRAGIHRRHRTRRALAWLQLGKAPLSRVGLF